MFCMKLINKILHFLILFLQKLWTKTKKFGKIKRDAKFAVLIHVT